LQFLPQRARAWAIQRWPLSPAWPNPEQALRDVLEVELVPKTEMKYYFSEILKERVLDLTKIDRHGRLTDGTVNLIVMACLSPRLIDRYLPHQNAQCFSNDAVDRRRVVLVRSSATSPQDSMNRQQGSHDANGRDDAQLRGRLRAVRGFAPVGGRLLARLRPRPHHRASVGPVDLLPAHSSLYPSAS
jgi:hypothetical protein